MTLPFVKRPSWMLMGGALLLGSTVAAADPWTLAPGEFYTNLQGVRGTSSNFFDAQRDRPPLAGGGTFEQRVVDWSTELGWKKRVSFLADLPFVSRSRVLESGLAATNTGLADLSLGLKGKILSGPTALALVAEWEAPLGYNRRLFPALGGGRQSALGLVELGGEIRPLQGFYELGGGYRARIDKFDDTTLPQNEVVATANLGFWVGNSLLIAGDYRGRFESNTAIQPVTEHLAGGRLLYRVDANLDIFAGSLHTVAGENVLHVDQYYAGIAARKTQLGRLQGFLGGIRKP